LSKHPSLTPSNGEVTCARFKQRGQMAIFVALIFQILFIFFALAINIGLVVHDKINLQNATDLAAYYAAQKQAEMLNAIDHTNYQIRQSWKLLNWRYYVLGSMGSLDPRHPTLPNTNNPMSEKEWITETFAPSVCINYGPNWADSGNDNTCKSQNFEFKNIEVPIIPYPDPLSFLFMGFVKNVQGKIANTCNGYAGLNWLFASWIYVAYFQDQRSRKFLIRALAENLARPADKMVDLNGDSVAVGAQNTFFKNLTTTNKSYNSNSLLTKPSFHVTPVGKKPVSYTHLTLPTIYSV